MEVGLQAATDILTAATKGCGSYAKPILRHITTVADFAKRDGVQVNTMPFWRGFALRMMHPTCICLHVGIYPVHLPSLSALSRNHLGDYSVKPGFGLPQYLQ